MQTELLDSALAMAGQSLHCHHPVNALPPNFAMDMAALDRQADGLRWQQLNLTTVGSSHAVGEQLLDHNNHFTLPAGMFFGTGEPTQESTEVLMREQTNITTTTTGVDGASMACGWPKMTQHPMTNHHVQPSFAAEPFTTVTESKPFSTLARTSSCPPAMGSILSSAARMGLRSCKIPSSPLSGDSSRKRKTLRNEVPAAPPTPKQVEGSKTIKGEILEADEFCPDTDKGGESSGNGGKENPKGAAPAIPKPDYIHVRARRGQATDSHSLAERVRREKISERMKLLQDLVPGCNKITGKAGMLDEIINYVQSLQRQVEFLSMKLAAVSPKSEGTGDSYLGKEVFPLCNSNFPGVGIPPEVTAPSYVHLNMMQSAAGASIQQQQGVCGDRGGRMDVSMTNNPSGMTTLRRTTSAPVTVTDDFIDSCFRDSSLPSNPAWDFDLQGVYTMDLHHQPRQQPAFSPQTSFVTSGHSEMHNLKMELM